MINSEILQKNNQQSNLYKENTHQKNKKNYMNDNFQLDKQNTLREVLLYKQNLSKVPLCCRTQFFDLQRIMHSQNRRNKFLSYAIPKFNQRSRSLFKVYYCSFLNDNGGYFYIGLKTYLTKNGQKRFYVKGSYFSQNDKSKFISMIREIQKQIISGKNVKLISQIQFIPVRNPLYNKFELESIMEAQKFAFQDIDLESYPFKPGTFVVRLKVPKGEKGQVYTCLKQQIKLITKNFKPNHNVPIRDIGKPKFIQHKDFALIQRKATQSAHQGPCLCPSKGIIYDYKQSPPKINLFQRMLQSVLQEEENLINQYMKQESEKINQIKKNHYNCMEFLNSCPLQFIVLGIRLNDLIRIFKPLLSYIQINTSTDYFTEELLIVVHIIQRKYIYQFLQISQMITSITHEKMKLIPVAKYFKFSTTEGFDYLLNKIHQSKLSKVYYFIKMESREIIFVSWFRAASFLLDSLKNGVVFQQKYQKQDFQFQEKAKHSNTKNKNY